MYNRIIIILFCFLFVGLPSNVFSGELKFNSERSVKDRPVHELVLKKYFSNYTYSQQYRTYKNGLLLNTTFNYNYHILNSDQIADSLPVGQLGVSLKTGFRLNIFRSFYLEPTLSFNPSLPTYAKGKVTVNSLQSNEINLVKITPFYSAYLVVGKSFGRFMQPTHAIEFILGQDTTIYDVSDQFSNFVRNSNNNKQTVSSWLVGARVLFGNKLKYGVELLLNSNGFNPYDDSSEDTWQINSAVCSFIYKFF